MFLSCCTICEKKKNLWYDLKKKTVHKIINMCVFAGFLLSPWCRLGYGWTRLLKIPPSGGPLPQPSPYIRYIQYICEHANFRRAPLRMFFTFFDTHTQQQQDSLCSISLQDPQACLELCQCRPTLSSLSQSNLEIHIYLASIPYFFSPGSYNTVFLRFKII